MQKFANNAWGTLASSITSTDTIINLTAGHGARFPTLAAGDYFDATLIDASKNLERIRVTARATDQLTVIRGQDGTTARAYSAGDLLELRWGNSDAESLRQESVRAVSLSGTNTYTGTLSPAPTAYNADQVYWLKFANTNTVTTPTVNLNSLGAKTLKYADGSAIPAGGLPTGVAVPFVYNGTDFLALDYPVQYGRTLVNPSNKSQTLTFGVTTNWDASSGQVAALTLTGNTTLAAPTNLKAGGHYTLRVVQDATGGRTITWNSAYVGVRGAAMPQPAPSANTTTVYHFVSDGTSLFLVSLSDDIPVGPVGTVPTGSVIPFAGSSAPSGWLLCDGSAVSRTTYAALFAVIGTIYGAGNGSTTFNLPDLRGRVVAGVDNMGGTAANRLTSGGSGISGTTLGASGGAETHTLTTAQMPSHTHGVSDSGHLHSSHSHSSTNMPVAVNYKTTQPVLTSTTGGNTGSATTGITIQSAGSGNAHQNTQPTIVLNYIIKT